MMRKLRDLQNEVEDRASELARKESQINLLDAEREAAVQILIDAEGKCPIEGVRNKNENMRFLWSFGEGDGK